MKPSLNGEFLCNEGYLSFLQLLKVKNELNKSKQIFGKAPGEPSAHISHSLLPINSVYTFLRFQAKSTPLTAKRSTNKFLT
jgi:hypothetical protein